MDKVDDSEPLPKAYYKTVTNDTQTIFKVPERPREEDLSSEGEDEQKMVAIEKMKLED